MSFDNIDYNGLQKINCLNPFGTGQCLSTHTPTKIKLDNKSQSLWNRAVSFDRLSFCRYGFRLGLNPFGTGQCLSTGKKMATFSNYLSQSLWNRAVSFDAVRQEVIERMCIVSIPLEQGSVFRLQWYFEALWHKAYESHFPTFSET